MPRPGKVDCSALGSGLEALAGQCRRGGRCEEASRCLLNTPVSPSSAGHQTDLRHLHQPRTLARLPEPNRRRRRTRDPRDGASSQGHSGAQLMSCLPVDTRGCGLVLRTAEPQRCLLGSLGEPGGRQEEGRGLGSSCHSRSLPWTRAPPSPKSQGPWCRSLCLCLSQGRPSPSVSILSLLSLISAVRLHPLLCFPASSFCLCVSRSRARLQVPPVLLCAPHGPPLLCIFLACPPTFIYDQTLLSPPCRLLPSH